MQQSVTAVLHCARQVDREFPFGLFELDWDVFMCHIEGAINRLPALEKTGIKSTVCGPESFTPDHNPIMGEAVAHRILQTKTVLTTAKRKKADDLCR